MEGESGSNTSEDQNEVVLPKLDGLFDDVASMVVRGYQLVSRAGFPGCFFVDLRRLIVQNLMCWY